MLYRNHNLLYIGCLHHDNNQMHIALHNAQGTNAQFGMGVIKVGVIKCNWHLSPTSAAALNAEFVDKAIVLFFDTFTLLLVALSFLPSCRIMTNQKRLLTPPSTRSF